MTCFFSQNQKHLRHYLLNLKLQLGLSFPVGKTRSLRWQSLGQKNILTEKQKAKFCFRRLCFSQIRTAISISSIYKNFHLESEDVVSGLKGPCRLFRQAPCAGLGPLPCDQWLMLGLLPIDKALFLEAASSRLYSTRKKPVSLEASTN